VIVPFSLIDPQDVSSAWRGDDDGIRFSGCRARDLLAVRRIPFYCSTWEVVVRRKLMFPVLVVAIGAFACAIAAGGAAARASSAKTVTCHLRLFDQSPPTALQGFDLGFVSCSRAFGNGVQSDQFKVRLTSPTTAVLTGPFKDFFDQGTIHGRFALHGTQTMTTGTVRFLGGTGAFKSVRGQGRLDCKAVSGNESDCTAVAKLTGI